MWGKSHRVQEPHGGPDRGQGQRKSIQKQLDSLLLRLQPTPVADERRRAVLEYVQEVVQREVPGSKVFPVGSFPLKTYLPYADVDMVMFSPRSGPSTGRVGESLGEVGARSSGKEGESSHELGRTMDDHPGSDDKEIADAVRTPPLIAVNQALCTVAALAGSKRAPPPHNGSLPSSVGAGKPEIRNVSFINARTPIVTMVVGNMVVDLTENQGGSVAASALLEEADNQIQRNHLFKRSLLVLKAWAWCETPRLVGKRVLGAQKGGLTSYGLSVMVLHLFASRASADDLLHPLDVFIRFFEVYSEFDWGRYCVTLDGPVPFGSARQPRPCGGSQGEGDTTSRLQPLVRRVLAELSPGAEKERGKEKEKEKQKEKAARRGRRASRFGRCPDGRGADSSAACAEASGSAAAAAPHFPRRDCNIQDPLNALNNLGHSVTKDNLKALERALQRGRQQLEAWQLLPRPVRSRSPRSDGPQRGPRKTDAARLGRSQGARSVADSCDTGQSEFGAGAGAEDHRVGNGGHNLAPSPQPASPVVEQFNSAPSVPHHFGPPAQQFVLLPPRQGVHPGAAMNTGPPQPVWVPGTHPLATSEGQPVVLAFPQPFVQAIPHQYQIAHQPQPYMVPQGQPVIQRPHSAVLVPAHGVQAHPNFSPQFQLQRVLPVTYQGDHQLGPGHQRFARMTVLPAGWRDQATARSEVHVAGPKVEERPKSAPRADKAEGSPVENGSCRGRGRKRTEEARDPSMQGSMLPWDLETFVNASATSSTASLSDFVEYGSKDGQDCQLQYESGADDEVHGGPPKESLFVSSFDGSDHSDTVVDTPHEERGEGHRTGTKRMSGNLWANRFLRELFPECCHRYGSGDGFREDLLDHPCQRRSKLQEPGAPPPRRHGAPDVLQGNSKDVWNSLTTVGEIVRETRLQTNEHNVKEAESSTENGQEAIGADRDGQGGGSGAGGVPARLGNQAGVERWVAQVRPSDAVAPAYTGGDHPAPSTNTGDDAREVDLLRPTWKTGEVGNGGRPQCGEGDGPKVNNLQVSVDDETGYTTSEEQGDREDATPSSEPPLPTIEHPSPTNPSPVSASTQTMGSGSAGTTGVDVGVQFAPEVVDQGVQCLAPVSKLMVSSASQCEGPGRILISTGVQCGVPAPARPVSRGTQCCSDATRGASIGVQCCLLVEEEAAAEKTPSAPLSPSSTRAGVGAEGSLADNPKDEREEACDSSGVCRGAFPTQLVPGAAGPIDSSGGACVDNKGTASKSKKKRKKSKATGVAARTAASEDAVDRSSEGSSKAISVGLGGWNGWPMRGMLFCVVVGVVLAAVWGASGRAGEESGQGGGLLTLHGVHKDHEERAQPPVWVMVGGSLTLGDVLAFRRSAAKEGGAGVQWFKGGRVLLGQTRPFLTISAASLEDEGTYACFAMEESGRIGSRALWEEVTVRISKPPIVESQLQTQRLLRGEMLAIVATASGVPQPEYQWRRNGVPIPGANRPMLVRHSVSEADMGTYTCDVYNVAGSVQWEEMAVILQEDGPKRRN